jgi:hypothetical protein
LPPLSDDPRPRKAAASRAHSKRFASFACRNSFAGTHCVLVRTQHIPAARQRLSRRKGTKHEN